MGNASKMNFKEEPHEHTLKVCRKKFNREGAMA